MRILAIRGMNLASLRGRFEVALDRPPLSQTGLFAITGPTGAGKSSILDALCLALFDSMPRLPEGHGVAVGRTDEDERLRIRSNDVRAVLSRGAGSGWAEVDFVGVDGTGYRARWEVRRARGRAAGRFQPQSVTLLNSGTKQYLGDTKSETLQLISDRLGLTFDQFRRSVLLAQGEFAAFLKANANDRSSLLERITGSELYTKLSIAAYRQATEETERLERLRERLQDLTPLGDEERAALDQRREQLSRSLETVEAEIASAHKMIDWYERLAGLSEEEAAASATSEKASLAWEATDRRRNELGLIEQVQPYRVSVEACNRTLKEGREAAEGLKRSQTQVEEAKERLLVAENTLRDVTEAHQKSEKAISVAHPRLIQARRLDSYIETAESTASAIENEFVTVQQKSKETERSLIRELDRQTELIREEKTVAAWLEEHGSYVPLVAEWGRWKSELHRMSVITADLNYSKIQLEASSGLITEHKKNLQEQKNKQRLAKARLGKSAARLKGLDAQARLFSLEELSIQRKDLETQRDGICEALELVRELRVGEEQLKQNRDALCEAERRSEEGRSGAVEVVKTLENRISALKEAEYALDLARATQSDTAETLRALLKVGEHCPVCGAVEHPWAPQNGLIDQQVERQQQRLTVLVGEKEMLIERGARFESQYEQAEERKKGLKSEIETITARMARSNSAWLDLKLKDKPDGRPVDAEVEASLGQSRDEIEKTLSETEKRERQAIEFRQQLDAKRQQYDNEKKTEEELTESVRDLREQLQLNSVEKAELEKRVSDLRQRQASLVDLLSRPLEPISSWQERLCQDPVQFSDECTGWVRAWKERESDKERITGLLHQVEKELIAVQSESNHNQAELKARKKSLNGEQERLNELREERSRLFAGRSADAVESELEKRKETAQRQKKEAQDNVNRDKGSLASGEQSVRHWRMENEKRIAARVEAEQGLSAILKAKGLNREHLDELLAYDLIWIETERQALETIEKELNRCRTVLKERVTKRKEHEKGRPEMRLEQVREELEQLLPRKEEESGRLLRILSEIEQDNERRISTDSLRMDLAHQQEQWKRWESLSQLIGSHDGKKFRTFAQSLTLDILLGYANGHLQDLSRRYYLQRVPNSDLELQIIDTDMGDEARSVHTLSGGESFLVSLALALGLASLSTNRTQVESLFIDEGFGTLDQESLEIAIDSLDTLQSLGRKVGVISHVPMLVERIGIQVSVEKQGGGKSLVRVKESGLFPS